MVTINRPLWRVKLLTENAVRLKERSPEKAGGGGQGIGEHYIAISLKQADVACYLKNGTVRRLLGHEDELCDAFPQLLGGSRGIASENVCELLRLRLREVAHLFNRELRHLCFARA